MGEQIKLTGRQVMRLRELDEMLGFLIHAPASTDRLCALGFAKHTVRIGRVEITEAGRQWLKDHPND
ncbi:MAG: hypothetical protein WA840_20565 [Caulobacteraceae bacterium]